MFQNRRNQYGVLGIGTGDVNIGDTPGEMGNALQLVDLGSDFVVAQLEAGQYFNCVLSADSDVKCWGKLSNLSFSIKRGRLQMAMGK